MPRLAEVYGSLFSGQSLALTPSETARVLLEKVGMDGASHQLTLFVLFLMHAVEQIICKTHHCCIMLLQNSERDASLLQLSICRRLFAELQTPLAKRPVSNSSCSSSQQEQLRFNTEVCRELNNTTEFVPTLVSHARRKLKG